MAGSQARLLAAISASSNEQATCSGQLLSMKQVAPACAALQPCNSCAPACCAVTGACCWHAVCSTYLHLWRLLPMVLPSLPLSLISQLQEVGGHLQCYAYAVKQLRPLLIVSWCFVTALLFSSLERPASLMLQVQWRRVP